MDENKPLVSIIMPICNNEKNLKESLKAVLEQTYENIEVLLVDDGSVDNSLKICREITKGDQRVKVFHRDNGGAGAARNRGIEAAHGKYVYFPDADDKVKPYAVEHMVKVISESGCDIAVFGYKCIFPDGKIDMHNNYPKKVLDGDYVRKNYEKFQGSAQMTIQGAAWNKIFNLERIQSYGVRFPSLRRHQDEVFVMRCVDVAERIVFTDDVIYEHYANDYKAVYKKFPRNYFDIVSRLNMYRVKYMYGWNKENKKLLDDISRVFINETTKSLMLLFNPCHKLGVKARYNMMCDIARRCVAEIPNKDYEPHSILYSQMKNKQYIRLYATSYLSLLKNRDNLR